VHRSAKSAGFGYILYVGKFSIFFANKSWRSVYSFSAPVADADGRHASSGLRLGRDQRREDDGIQRQSAGGVRRAGAERDEVRHDLPATADRSQQRNAGHLELQQRKLSQAGPSASAVTGRSSDCCAVNKGQIPSV